MVLDDIFENNLLRFDLFLLSLLRNQRTQADNSEVLRKPSLDLIEAKVIRIEFATLRWGGSQTSQGHLSQWRWGPRQIGKPFELGMVSDTIHG